MALTPLIGRFHEFSKTYVFQVHPKYKEKSWDLGKTLFWELVPCIEVTFFLKFHPI
jgi:hypothetical protein